jgi:hypothetical protein
LNDDDLLKELHADIGVRVSTVKEMVVPVVLGGAALFLTLWVLLAKLLVGPVYEALAGFLTSFLGGALSHFDLEPIAGDLGKGLAFAVLLAAFFMVCLHGAFAVGAAILKRKEQWDLYEPGTAAKIEPHQVPLLSLAIDQAVKEHDLKFFSVAYDWKGRRWNYRISIWRAVPVTLLAAGIMLAGLQWVVGKPSPGSADRFGKVLSAGEVAQPTASAERPGGKAISLRNRCPTAVDLVLAWRATGANEWTLGEWKVEASSDLNRLLYGEVPLTVTSDIYFHARSVDGRHIWRGKSGDDDAKQFDVEGESVLFRRKKITGIPEGGDQILLTCE